MIQPNITRRTWFASAGLLTSAGMVAAGAGPKGHPPAPEKYPRNLTKEDVDRWMTELSNWGKWGKDDQAGTINLITPAKRKSAAALVKEGISVSASLDADLPKEGSTGVPLGGGGGPRGGAPGPAGQGTPPAAGAQSGAPPAAANAPAGEVFALYSQLATTMLHTASLCVHCCVTSLPISVAWTVSFLSR